MVLFPNPIFFFMKWSDIKKSLTKNMHPAPVAVSSESVSKKHFPWKALVFGIVTLVCIAIAVFILIKVFGKKSTPVLPPEELHAIGTFLEENPPQPVTNEQSDMITNTLDQPVELDTNDAQALNNFFKK